MKKGIVELADLVVINKADGDLLPAAQRIKTEYISALRLIRSKSPHWVPKVTEGDVCMCVYVCVHVCVCVRACAVLCPCVHVCAHDWMHSPYCGRL